ncbi:hypothetical protein [Streptomyces rapamycinicus]|uniref:Uncharacterized protein n=1 Tax=Streptomyces rapamycinicus TaxID=1226757 RepID=A0ABR6M3W2_9ACTN|nr:hypothetical protein [Streptomyces rapamycinicus]MBB4789307.1 hypothetical protein [Streptomyces rapamycinicus]
MSGARHGFDGGAVQLLIPSGPQGARTHLRATPGRTHRHRQ